MLFFSILFIKYNTKYDSPLGPTLHISHYRIETKKLSRLTASSHGSKGKLLPECQTIPDFLQQEIKEVEVTVVTTTFLRRAKAKKKPKLL